MNREKSSQGENKVKDVSKTCQKRVWYDSNLTHINGWFDFGSTLGRVLTGKTLKTLVAAITLVLMVIGAGDVWGQTNITWNDALENGHEYSLGSDCSTTYVFTENDNRGDYSKWVYFTAPTGCRVKITLTANGLASGGSSRDRLDLKDGRTQPDGDNNGGANVQWTNQSGNAIYISSGNELAIRFRNKRANGNNNNSTFTFRVECMCVTDGESINMQDGEKLIDCNHLYKFYDSGGENGNYSNNENYTYTFKTGQSGTVIHILFFSFSSSYYNGNGDYITINGGGNIGTMTVPQEYVTAAGNDLVITWHSNGYTNNNGWYAVVWAEGCPTCEDNNPVFSPATIDCSLGSPCTPLPSLTNNSSTGNITYTSSDESVATVDNNGALTLVGGGTSTITATIAADDDYCAATASYTLTITCLDPQLTLSEPSGTMVIGGGTLNVGALASSNSSGTITWSSSNDGVATVDGDGVVTAGGVGIATITGIQAASGSYCSDTVRYTVSVQCADVAIAAINSHSENVPCMDEGDGICYLNVCAPETITLSKTGTMNPSSYTWRWNCYDNTGENTSTGAILQLSLTQQRGYDVWMTVSGGGCEVTRQARIRVSRGIVIHAGDLSDIIINDDGAGNPQPICVGTEACITIGSGSGSDVQIEEPSVHVEAALGQGVQTFIPDGPNCDVQCYTSSVTFSDFDASARVTSADDIRYLKINMEHSFIGDMQIKLICPNNYREVIILEDRYSTAQGGADNYTYDWPYRAITVECIINVYENRAGANGCTQGNFIGAYYYDAYVVYDGVNYSTTFNPQEATLFENLNNQQIAAHANAARNSGNNPDDYCIGSDYYIVFSSWGYDNGAAIPSASLAFGHPNLTDASSGSQICNSAYNPAGTGADYCWSNNNDYTYAGGTNGYVYETANHQAGTTSNRMVIPSDMSDPDHPTQVYHPKEGFGRLIGCPLNGTWTVQVCDAEGLDNGWIFNWELKLSEDKLPTMWGFDISLDTSMLTCTGTVHTEYNKPNLCVSPRFGDDNSGCKLTFIDNFGCETSVENEIKFTLDSAWANLKSGTNNQSYCLGSSSMAAITYAYGGKADKWSIEWKKDGVTQRTLSNQTTLASTALSNGVMISATSSTNPENGRITINGTPNVPGVYSYTITAHPCASSGCEHCIPNVKTGTITVYETPIVNAGTDIVNCTAGQSTTLTATATYTYGDVDIESWSWTPSTDLAAPTNASTVEAAPTTTRTYTVTATDEHGCSNSDQVQVTVNQLNATIEFGD